MTNTNNINNPEIPALTGLRFFAAFFVLVSHGLMQIMPMNGTIPAWYSLFSTLSGAGMTLFFVLSGFVIHYNYSASIQQNPKIGIYDFFVARFARLYPLFLVGLSFDLIHLYGYTNLTQYFRQAIPYYLTLTQSWFYIPLGNNGLIYQFGSIPTVAWSVSTEWFFYLAYPLICFSLIKLRGIKLNLIVFIALNCFIFFSIYWIANQLNAINQFAANHFGAIADINTGNQSSFLRWLIYFSPYSRIWEFLVGCLTAAIYMQSRKIEISTKEQHFGKRLIIFVLISTFIIQMLFYFPPDFLTFVSLRSYFSTLAWCFGLAPSIAIIIFCCARYQNNITRFLEKPIFITTGLASYSLYLFHLPILQAFSRDAAPVTRASNLRIYFADFSRLTLAMTAAIGFSIIFYHLIEVPCRRYLRKKLSLPSKKLLPKNESVALQNV